MPIFHHGNQTLAYDDTGGNGSVVVFSHSFGMNGSMFAPQCDAFRSRYRCITWDQRGHGGSLTDRNFTFWESAADCLALLDHLNIQAASFVGTSQGGFVSLRIALLAPDRVRSLAVLGSSASAEAEDHKASYLQMNAVFSAAGESGPPDEILDAMSYICFSSKSGAGGWREIWRRWPVQQATFALQALVQRDDLTDRLGEIRAPTLVLHGTADHSYAVSHGEAIADRVPGSEGCVVIEGGAHFLSITNPEPINAALEPFLSRHASRPV
ncbi:alpha/beta hydrolase [Bradyrhizobium sp. Ai1a-2]|uniref:alpha/beta fold hydrolase n=1 Tax=Bradyrhizobium sp. Ai1a-2 TaxID=196490 RepID=UPI0004828DFA|nr:alpha/beta hydrolase [Bradyrhizobium sp. Ai1a-2]